MPLFATVTNYTWQQTLRYFAIGAVKCVLAALAPVAFTVWHNYSTYNDPQDWVLIEGLIVTTAGPALINYVRSRKNLLKAPPWLYTPPEFQPPNTTVERSEHSTTVTREGEAGTVTTERSPHTSTTTTIRDGNP